MKEGSSSVLTSPGFLIALALLLLNDFFFKAYLHNPLTGKLSDFAGLFVFPLFWATLLPRLRAGIYLSTALLFIFWKSGASAELINDWNSLGLFSINRTIDYSDLIALAILPVSYIYGLRSLGLRLSRAWPAVIAIVSLFAFAATSFSHKTSYDKDFYFAMPKHDLLERMSRLPKDEVNRFFWEADDFTVSIESCIEAGFSIQERDHQSVLTLKETNFRCPTPPAKEDMLTTFEQEFIAKLIEGQITTPTKIKWILGNPKFPSPSPSPSQSGTQKAANSRATR